MKQKDAILAALRAGDRLTPLDALYKFGCNRLAARVWELKLEGHPVTSRLVKRGGAEVAEYALARDGELFA